MRKFCIYLEGNSYDEDGFWCALSGDGCNPFTCEKMYSFDDLGGDTSDAEWAAEEETD